jgi:hypothetical protein
VALVVPELLNKLNDESNDRVSSIDARSPHEVREQTLSLPLSLRSVTRRRQVAVDGLCEVLKLKSKDIMHSVLSPLLKAPITRPK